jgi:hypothetical protein
MQYSTPIKYGIIAGLLMIVGYVLIYLVDAALLASLLTLSLYIILIFCMVYGGITYRKEIGGFDSFGQAFLAVFITAFLGSFFIDVFGFIMFKFIDPALVDVVKEAAIEKATAMMEKFNVPDDQMEKQLKQLKATDYTPNLKSQGIRFLSSTIVGAILSLLIAVFVRRNDRVESNG